MDEFGQAVYLFHARILKALAHPSRLMILDCLHSGEKSVSELVELLGLPQANVSQHLAALRSQEIIASRRQGNIIYYSLVDSRIVQACNIFHDFLADRVKNDQAFANQFPSLRPFQRARPAG